ncbi:unnamed protein product [Linum trigynum]|uniref:Reverse transcriptase domain-containing protein n=1 Tax=Linum trigynum TaxID=586398 RepID=A0AAV2CY76_9ROSI
MKRREKAKDGFFAAKLDMAKAYDRVEWDFLERVMKKLGFEERWVALVMKCVTSVTYSILVNGHKSDTFSPSRGLRQGDPLSPYLFLLCAEGLTSLVKKTEEEGNLHGIQMRKKAPTISRLLFADDCVIFGRAVLKECDQLKDILKIYANEYGQLVNFSKSELSFSKNVRTSRRLEICGTLGIKEVEKLPKYLDLPTVIGRSKKAIFEEVKERVRKKLKDWKSRTMSTAGKEIMIKAIAQAQCLYPMSVFHIPESTLKEIQRLIANFWWGQKGKEFKIHWLEWDDLCDDKAEGGMGFRDLRSFNYAMLGKQIWNVLTRPQSLMARVLKARYFPKTDILQAKLGYQPSYIWKSIMGAKEKIEEGFRWRVGNGESIQIWKDEWIPGKSFYQADPVPTGEITEDRVSNIIDYGSGGWDMEKIKALFSTSDQNLIAKIPLKTPLGHDSRVWKAEEDGIYSVKSAYYLIRRSQAQYQTRSLTKNQEDSEMWKVLWKLNVQPKVRVFLWKVCREILPVGVNIEEWIDRAAPECPFCNLVETQMHALHTCDWIRRRWKDCEEKELFELGDGKTSSEWIGTILRNYPENKVQRFCSILWYLWKERCNHKFNNQKLDEEEIVPRALGWLSSYLAAQSSSDSQMSISPSAGRVAQNGRWSPPPEGFIKLNTDAGVFQQQGIGFGCIFRDGQGAFVGALAKKEKGVCRPIEAEARAMVMGLREANRRLLGPLIVESYCQSLVKMLKNGDEDFTELGVLCEELRKLASVNESLVGDKVRWVFSPRKTNSVAHWLAHVGLGWNQQWVWVDNPPMYLRCLIEDDVGHGAESFY